jgi:hypothetical protein
MKKICLWAFAILVALFGGGLSLRFGFPPHLQKSNSEKTANLYTPEKAAVADNQQTEKTHDLNFGNTPPQQNAISTSDLPEPSGKYTSTAFEGIVCRQTGALAARIYDPELPLETGGSRPSQAGHVWLRIRPEDYPNLEQIMATVADLYHQLVDSHHPVEVIYWVGGHPRFSRWYSPGNNSAQKDDLFAN